MGKRNYHRYKLWQNGKIVQYGISKRDIEKRKESIKHGNNRALLNA